MQNQTAIDKVDGAILRTLLREARTTFTDIAKECNISVGAIKARYERLKKEGIITGEIMQVNPRAVGFNNVADLGIATTVENEEEVSSFLKTKPHMFAYGIGTFWKFNIGAFVVLKDINRLPSIEEELHSNPLIRSIDTLIWVEPVNMDHTENLVVGDNGASRKNTKTASQKMQKPSAETHIDETDRKIARILSQKARTPFRRIAEELNISTKSVIQRYHKLRTSVLTLSTITVSLEKLGYKAVANIMIKATRRNEIPRICEQILEIPNSIVMIRLIGSYDMRVIFAVKNFKDLFGLGKQIRMIQGIAQADIYLHEPFYDWPLNLFAPLLH